MKLVDISCPSCGATLQVNEGSKSVNCSYCGKTFLLDDEIKRVEHTVKNAEQAGYEFEKGRIKANYEEAYRRQKVAEMNYNQNNTKPEEKHGGILLKIILWILFFPIMLGYKIIKSTRLDFETKVFVIIIIAGAVIYFMSGGRLWS